jgi:hypothetical protein
VAYRKQNENQSLHKNISHIQDPEHFREQEDFIRKIICEREELKKKYSLHECYSLGVWLE